MWRKSTHSDADCVELNREGQKVFVRDSKYPDTQLKFSKAEWDAFMAEIRPRR